MYKPKHRAKPVLLPILARIFLCVVTFVLIAAATLYLTMEIICYGGPDAKNTFITTVLETGQLKFLASLCLSDEEIAEVISNNSVEEVKTETVDEGLIASYCTDAEIAEYGNEIEISQISGLTYKATAMIVRNPSRLVLDTIVKPDGTWPEKGITLEDFVKQSDAVGAINGGLYNSTNNTGGSPRGVVVSHGKIVRNCPNENRGLVLVGMNDKNVLQIADVSGMTSAECEKMICEKGIRDAVSFQEDLSVDNNHFVSLIVNGEARNVSGKGSGLNPRTAIGQRADGALILLVTDGRGYNGHAGASAADLIGIMNSLGAVNAANLDGGSSTCMYYDGEYLQDSVTFYYSQSSWKLPFAFLVK